MSRPLSQIAPDWWDYTTLDADLIRDAAALTPRQMKGLSRPGFKVVFYDTLEDFYLAEALEVHPGMESVHPGQSGRYLRPHWSHRATPSGGAFGQRTGC